jgi:hypothetical protein
LAQIKFYFFRKAKVAQGGKVTLVGGVNDNQTSALAKLLGEGDPSTTSLVCEQLKQSPEEWRPQLEALTRMDNENVSRAAHEILFEFNRQAAEEDFDLLCRFFPEDGNLEEACWSLAGLLDPAGDVPGARHHLTVWGRMLLLKIAGAISARERVKILSTFLTEELYFRGNQEDYYNPENSILTRVIETRRGLPITLSCLAIFLAHRAGMNVVGINLPGHFIVRHSDVFFDPFHGGRILSVSDCEEILRCQGLDPNPECFSVASPRRILQRILCNLHYNYDRSGCVGQAGKMRAWLEALRRTP